MCTTKLSSGSVLFFTITLCGEQFIYWLCFFFCPACDAVAADIQFLLDTSGSVGSTEFAKVRDFVKAFAENFDIGPGSVHIGVTSFDTTPQNEFWLNQHTDKASLLAAIDQIQYRGGQTYTAEALQFIRENAFISVSTDFCLFASHVHLFCSLFCLALIKPAICDMQSCVDSLFLTEYITSGCLCVLHNITLIFYQRQMFVSSEIS